MSNQNELLRRLAATTSSAHFRLAIADKEMQQAVCQLVGETLPVSDLGLSQKSLRKLKRLGIDSICQLIGSFAGGINGIAPATAEYKDIAGQLELYIRELLELVTKTEETAPAPEEEAPAAAAPVLQTEGKKGKSRDSEKEDDDALFIRHPQYDAALELFLQTETTVEELNLSVRTFHCLKRAGINTVAELMMLTNEKCRNIKNLGDKGRDELRRCVLLVLDEGLHTLEEAGWQPGETLPLPPEPTHYEQEEIRELLLCTYGRHYSEAFYGFSFREFRDRLPEAVSDEALKAAVSSLLRDGMLEYVDFRCYRVYPKFFDAMLEMLPKFETHLKICRDCSAGRTLQEIGDEYNVTKERIRQMQNQMQKRCSLARRKLHTPVDEDYYRYLYENYAIPKDIWTEYLHCPADTLSYLMLFCSKGTGKVEDAMDDPAVTVNQKFCLQKYLDRYNVRINGTMLKKKRAVIEEYILSHYCRTEMTYKSFADKYNSLLEEAGVKPEEALFIRDEDKKNNIARIGRNPNVIWKQGERLRYYDVESYDFTELLETLDLAQYQNTEISTNKWMLDYPALMQKYDIRDEYELHNLLRNIVQSDEYPGLKFKRQPIIQFGDFDRKEEMHRLVAELSPVKTDTLIRELQNRYGFSEEMIRSNCLNHIGGLFYQGAYSVNPAPMPQEYQDRFLSVLTEDFYTLEQLRTLYTGHFPEADPECLNPHSLRQMGFLVNSSYAIRNFRSAEEYFRYILRKEDMTDITALQKKYAAPYNTLNMLVRQLYTERELLYFEPGKTLHIRRLGKLGVTKEQLADYCDQAIAFAGEDRFFTITWLRRNGFTHPLDALGLEDYFYGSLLASDPRLVSSKMAGELVLHSDNEKHSISRVDFLSSLIRGAVGITISEVIKRSVQLYGVNITDKYLFVSAAAACGMYYDETMEKIYRDKSYYYEDLEKMETEDY